MPQSFSQLIVQAVFSTKGRAASIPAERRPELFAYLAVILKTIGGRPILINGVAVHVHLLFALPATLRPAGTLRAVKAKSSAWMRSRDRQFGWQAGYAAFSVSKSNVEAVTKYIAGQEERHKRVRFEDEFLALLKRHNIDYGERYVWR